MSVEIIPRANKFRLPWPKLLEGLWAVALVGLPITSFTWLAQLTGALTAPLSALPILLLLVLYCLPLILRGASLPKESFVLVIFIFMVLISSARAFFIDIPTFKGKTVFDQEIRSLLTLAIGISFYLVFAMFPNTPQRLQKTWQWINVGGLLTLAFAMIQAFFIFRRADFYPAWFQTVQDFFVFESPQLTLWHRRVNGLTYEASWFAHQMVLLYLPLWFAATFQRYSAFRFRIWHLSFENMMLVVGIFFFFMSSPRVGLVSFLLIIGYLFLLVNLRLIKRITGSITNLAVLQRSPARGWLRGVIVFCVSVLVFAFYVGLFAAAIYFSSQRDARLALLIESTFTWQELWGALTLNEYFLLLISLRLVFVERMIYWITGWHIFQLHPFLGVGLGNAGFFFPSQLPAQAWASVEVRNLLFRIKAFPNVKSLWMRLLAETGIIGFAVFVTWGYILFRSALLSYRSHSPLIKTFALAGQLGLIALIAEGFSVDSFAMPYLWVTAGLLSATGLIHRQEIHQQKLIAETDHPAGNS